ncbi:MAG: glycoside hydrolase family 27 protein [Luteolibacter sp.]
MTLKRTSIFAASALATALLCLSSQTTRAEASPAFHSWAAKPPLGWNSWDCFGTTVTEAQTRAQIDVMADKLKSHGWEYIVVDIQWYEPDSKGFKYRTGAPLVMDEWGRLLPAENRFPSAANGVGFKALAKAAHDKGLKFGLHIMRGIPRQAVDQNTPIKGTSYRATDIADTSSLCEWNPDMYGVDMSKPGAQEYYDSVYELLTSWDIDFIKVDDLSRPYHKKEIEAIRKAIDKTGRHIVFSTSPGETPVADGAHVMNHANMWRISDDFWDTWKALFEQFKRLDAWTPYRGEGHFPDADMLPLGAVRQVGSSKHRPPYTRFTKDEQVTMMTLWSIARSPLIMGGDLSKLDEWTLSLLTNDEVLSVNQDSSGNRQLFRRDGLIGWIADVPGSPDKYLALFNTTETAAEVSVALAEVGFAQTSVKLRNLWKKADLENPVSDRISLNLSPHASALYRVSPRP